MPQHIITREIQIDAGHRVPAHGSKCRHLHGHRYKIILALKAPQLKDDKEGGAEGGMVADFGFVKELMMRVIHDRYDHKMLLWIYDSCLILNIPAEGLVRLPCIPTAERLAEHWSHELIAEMPPEWQFHFLRVWETPNCYAEFRL